MKWRWARAAHPPLPPVWDEYRALLRAESALPPEAWTFKHHPACQTMVENVTPEQDAPYATVLRRSPRWAADKAVVRQTAAENDALGQPERRPSALGVVCSPTNLRYAWQAQIVAAHLERLALGPADILEVGAGYGGLALYLRRLAPARVRSHTLIDLPEAGPLQASFCHALGVPVRVADGTDPDALERALAATDPAARVFVSCYGFGEFPVAAQDWYAGRLARHCPHGLVVWNWTEPYPLYDPEVSPMTVEEEPVFTEAGTKVVTY